jgi:uncharacterized repeat protein (TIGR03803 family)
MPPKPLLLVLLIFSSLAGQGQYHFRVLHAFGNGNDGAGVWSSVTLDKTGTVYGTTSGGGTYKGGTVFRLNLAPNGRWTETILHTFGSGHDGAGPFGGVVLGPSSALYGATQVGGTYDAGVVFKLTIERGQWREAILHNFCARPNCDDGSAPWGSLTIDPKGNLYGTAYVAFELLPHRKGWSDATLHVFTGKNGDGQGPFAGPIRDAARNLYGTTLGGGGGGCGGGCGTVWELSPPAPGSGAMGWTEHILHRFGVGDNLAFPGVGQLAMDSQGNLYGAVDGGTHRAGVIYKLSPIPNGSAAGDVWRETILYNFTGGLDGGPSEGVTLDKAGNLYGTTGVGGKFGAGTVFKLSPQPDGSWKFTLLHTFTGADGAEPANNPTLGPDGKLYGTAATGGKYGGGVVFQITP